MQSFRYQRPICSMTSKNQRQRTKFFDKYEWWFVIIGLIGNAFFFFGSVSFLFKELETLAICLFITGSCFMLVSSSAESLAEYTRTAASSKQVVEENIPIRVRTQSH